MTKEEFKEFNDLMGKMMDARAEVATEAFIWSIGRQPNMADQRLLNAISKMRAAELTINECLLGSMTAPEAR